MSSNAEPGAALVAQREALRRQLRHGLLEQAPLAELQALQARLQLLEQALAAARPPGQGWRRQAIALGVVAALVSAAALLPMPRLAFALEVEAGAAQLTLDEAGQLGGQTLGAELRAEGFTRLESADPELMRRAREEGPSPLVLRAERLALRGLTYGAGTRLEVEAGQPAARLAIEGAAHTAQFEFGGAVLSSLGGAPRVASLVPVVEWLRLDAAADARSELWLPRVAGPGWPGWQWRGLRPTALRFIERSVDAEGAVRLDSALRSASLRLPEIERELRPAAGSVLELDDLRVEQCELLLGETVRLRLNGSARHIELSTGGFSRSLAPSLLEYAARNHGLGLFWSAAGLLWGISTWLRKQFDAAA